LERVDKVGQLINAIGINMVYPFDNYAVSAAFNNYDLPATQPPKRPSHCTDKITVT